MHHSVYLIAFFEPDTFGRVRRLHDVAISRELVRFSRGALLPSKRVEYLLELDSLLYFEHDRWVVLYRWGRGQCVKRENGSLAAVRDVGDGDRVRGEQRVNLYPQRRGGGAIISALSMLLAAALTPSLIEI